MEHFHSIRQELYFFSCKQGNLMWRVEEYTLPQGIAPDKYIRDLLGWTDTAGGLLHSTSWRYDFNFDPHLVLCWAVIPSVRESDWVVLEPNKKIKTGADSAHPVPDELERVDVARHAARHIAFLLHNDASVYNSSALTAELKNAFAKFEYELAGEV